MSKYIQLLSTLKTKLEGFKTYIILALWLLSEATNLLGILPFEIGAIRALALPLIGLTVNAKLNRTL